MTVKQIDEPRLETDPAYRYEFLVEFIGFTKDDIAAIHGAASKLVPIVPKLVDATYEKLLSYDATRRHFVPRQHGFEGPTPPNAESLSSNAEQIKFRKDHLRRYFMNIFGNAYDVRMAKYLDAVGKIHTPKAGNKEIDVPLVQMNALMGVIADELIKAVMTLGFDREKETRTLLAFNKLLWLQNDFINRHYAAGTT